MVKKHSCSATAADLFGALQTLPGKTVDAIEKNRGSLGTTIEDVCEALRKAGEEGTFKPTVIEDAFVKWDRRNQRKLSQAAGQDMEDWAIERRKEVREQLSKENKRGNSQRFRDGKKQAPMTKEKTHLKQSANKPDVKNPAAKSTLDGPEVQPAIPGYQGKTKLVAIPEAISEDVLAAALKAAMGAATLEMHGLRLSAPASAAQQAGPCKRTMKRPAGQEAEEGTEDEKDEDDDEEEEDSDEEEDEEVGEEGGEEGEEDEQEDEEADPEEDHEEEDDDKEGPESDTPTPVNKRPAAAVADNDGGGKVRKIPADDGWTVVLFTRGPTDAKAGATYKEYVDENGIKYRSLKHAVAAGFPGNNEDDKAKDKNH